MFYNDDFKFISFLKWSSLSDFITSEMNKILFNIEKCSITLTINFVVLQNGPAYCKSVASVTKKNVSLILASNSWFFKNNLAYCDSVSSVTKKDIL